MHRRSYTDINRRAKIHTKTSAHTFFPTPRQTLFHFTTHERFISLFLCQCIFLSVIFSTLLHSTLSFYLSTVCSYLSLLLLPWQSSLAMGLCPFIIHGVVLMARAAMSDVNLRASQAHSAYNASARGATTELTVLRYTEINTLTHTCK